jgi:6-phosphogluconolactonase
MQISLNKIFTGVIIFSLLSCNNKTTESKSTDKQEITQPKSTEFLVGTYTDASSKGIYKFNFNPNDGTIENKGLVAEAMSPSYLDISRDKQFIYAINERDPGKVSSYKWNEDRTELIAISKVSSEGVGPCFVEINNLGNLLTIANYSSGNMAVYSVVNGKIEEEPDTRQHVGSSIVKPNQNAPHAHCSRFGTHGKYIYVADLGIDEVVSYSVNQEGDLGEKQIALEMDEGDGPRHLVFHPSKDMVFIINELSSSVTSAKVDISTGLFEKIDKKSTLPTDYTEKSYCADIHISSDGKFLYASNRGHNSIAVFSVSEEGKLELLATTPVEGDWPRNFTISPEENYLLVANQKSDNITVFQRNQKTGLLTFTGNEVKLSKPVCLKF